MSRDVIAGSPAQCNRNNVRIFHHILTERDLYHVKETGRLLGIERNADSLDTPFTYSFMVASLG